MVDEAHAIGRDRPRRPRLGRRGRARRRGRRGRRHARQGARRLRRLRLRERRAPRAARQHRPPVHLLDRPAAALGAAPRWPRSAARARPGVVERLRRNAAVLREALRAQGLDVGAVAAPRSSRSWSAMPGTAMALCERALEGGVFAQAIRPPTVPAGTSRLRLTVMATHRTDELQTRGAGDRPRRARPRHRRPAR